MRVFHGVLRGEEFGAFAEICRGDHLLGGNFFDVRVCDKPGCVGEANAESFDDGVEVGGRVVVGFLIEVRDLTGFLELFEYAQRHQSNHSLSIGRMFPDFDSFVIGISVDNMFVRDVSDFLPFEVKADRVDELTAKFCMILEVSQFEMTT